MSAAPAPENASARRLHVGELVVDLVVVGGSALYVHAAGAYPPQGRQIPLVVGWLAIGLGVLHLLGHVVPGLWAVTHDSAARGGRIGEGARKEVARRLAGADAEPAAAAPGTAREDGETGPAVTGDAVVRPPAALRTSMGAPRQVVAAIAWAAGLLAGVCLVGFAVALPAFFLVYFGVMRAWRTAVISAVVMWALAEGLFVYALSVPLPEGLLW